MAGDVTEGKDFFAVFDGHGGPVVARYCGKHMHESVVATEAYAKGDFQKALLDGYKNLDEKLVTTEGVDELLTLRDTNANPLEIQNKSALPEMQGCTAVSALIADRVLYTANTGDSRAVLCRKFKAEALTVDHKPDDEPEYKRIDAAGGFVAGGRVNGSLNLSRCMGDFQFKGNKNLPAEKQIITCVPDTAETRLTPDDAFLIIGCDGIWDVMPNQNIVNFVITRLLPQSALSDAEKELDTTSLLDRYPFNPEIVARVETIADEEAWPGDVATSLEDLCTRVCKQITNRCCAPGTSAGIGCDNMTVVIVLFRESAFVKRVEAELNKRLASAPPPAAETPETDDTSME